MITQSMYYPRPNPGTLLIFYYLKSCKAEWREKKGGDIPCGSRGCAQVRAMQVGWVWLAANWPMAPKDGQLETRNTEEVNGCPKVLGCPSPFSVDILGSSALIPSCSSFQLCGTSVTEPSFYCVGG